ncbi:MAG: O-antigen ligase family protein [Thermodesulfobacteriota bacterium]|nr:O-antigen ligase family protein [Thermodesulfobacteriota bacterium]
MLRILIHFEIFIKLALILLLLWGSYRTIFKKDRAVGLVLYLGIVIIVDSFFNTGIYIPGLEKGSIRYSEVCAFFLILNNPSKNLTRRSHVFFILLLFLYFVFFFYAGLRGDTLKLGIFEFRRYIVPQIVAFLVAYRGFQNKEDYRRFLFYLMTLIIIIALFTFWDVFFDRWLLKSDTLNEKTYWGGRRHGRFGSFFLNPNYMGAFAVLFFPIIFIQALTEKTNWKRIYCWLGVLALVFALIETQSRGPLLSFCISLIVFILIPSRNYSLFKKVGSLVLLLILLYAFMPGFFEHSIQRFSMLEAEANEETRSRKTVWIYTLKVIADSPYFGIGLGEIKYIKSMIQAGFVEEYSIWPLDNPHNSYLQIAVYSGIPALVIFILLNILLTKKSVSKILTEKEQWTSFYLIGFVAGMIGFLTSLITDMHMFVPSIVSSYWICFGIVFSLISIETERSHI